MQLFAIMAHFSDIALDLNYMFTVPTYHWSVSVILFFSFMSPLIYAIYVGKTSGAAKGILTYFGLMPLYMTCCKK